MKKFLKAYLLFILALIFLGLVFLYNFETGKSALKTIGNSSLEMLKILPPVLILLGLLDVWVPRETMVKFMGKGSGIKGPLLAFIIGSAAAGPLYVVFPIAAAFMKKDVSFYNILVLIGAWSTTKIPMLLFEYSSMGPSFMLTRLAVNIPAIFILALLIKLFFKEKEIEAIYDKARQME